MSDNRGLSLVVVSTIYYIFVIIFMVGCNVSANWIEVMIDDFEITISESNKSNADSDERSVALNKIVRKYFYEGMAKRDAEKLLFDLKDYGFDVGEYRHEGARSWPNGRFRPYVDEEIKRHLQRLYKPGISKFVAVLEERNYIFVTTFVSIGFYISDDDNIVSDITAHFSASFI